MCAVGGHSHSLVLATALGPTNTPNEKTPTSWRSDQAKVRHEVKNERTEGVDAKNPMPNTCCIRNSSSNGTIINGVTRYTYMFFLYRLLASALCII